MSDNAINMLRRHVSLRADAERTFREFEPILRSQVVVPFWRELRMVHLYRPQISPVLPFEINATLGELLTLSAFPDLIPVSRYDFDEMRHFMISRVEDYISADSVGCGISLMQDIWRDRSEFCLYLRDFALAGVARYEPAPATVFNPSDLTFQRGLADAIPDDLPIVGLSNYADPLPIGPIATVYTQAERWRDLVVLLVDAAALIVINAGDMSDGVITEFNIIREHNRRDVTVVVSGNKEVPLPDDFSNRIVYSDQDDEAWIGEIRDIARRARDAEGRKFAALVLDAPLPPRHMRELSAIVRRLWLKRGSRALAKRTFNPWDVENTLVGAFAMCCWEVNHHARAEILWRLGAMQTIRAYLESDSPQSPLRVSDFAIANLRRAMRIVEGLIRKYPSAIDALYAAEGLLNKLREDDTNAADELIERLQRLRELAKAVVRVRWD